LTTVRPDPSRRIGSARRGALPDCLQQRRVDAPEARRHLVGDGEADRDAYSRRPAGVAISTANRVSGDQVSASAAVSTARPAPRRWWRRGVIIDQTPMTSSWRTSHTALIGSDSSQASQSPMASRGVRASVRSSMPRSTSCASAEMAMPWRISPSAARRMRNGPAARVGGRAQTISASGSGAVENPSSSSRAVAPASASWERKTTAGRSGPSTPTSSSAAAASAPGVSPHMFSSADCSPDTIANQPSPRRADPAGPIVVRPSAK
jgi:hypothetical protein